MMWIVLVCASFCELGFTVCMKLSDGFKNKKFTVLTVLITALGIFLLSTATKTLPLGIAYAVWTGLGTVFTVLFGIFVFKESRDRKKIFFMCLVVAGVIGLMKDLGYGDGYQYAHDTEEKLTNMQCLPDSLLDRQYYRPTDQGVEARFKERLQQIKAWKKKHSK